MLGSRPETIIRLARPSENGSVHALVQTIADETRSVEPTISVDRYVPLISSGTWDSLG
jgi:hypothetical protein